MIWTFMGSTLKMFENVVCRVPSETAITASAISRAVRSTQQEKS